MLPPNRLLNLRPLYSGRQQTFYTPETLFLSIGIGQPIHRADDAIATLVHEGIHWRQFQGTTFGAFCHWLKHSQEVNIYDHFRALPDDARRELLSRRAAGTPILSLHNDTDLPDPPISSVSLQNKNRLELLKTIFFDHLFTYAYFRNSADVSHQPGPPQELFASAIADAAATLIHEHPSWRDMAYADVQDFYTLEKVGKVTGLGKELGTKDLLEGAAAANEVLFHSLISEQRYLLTDEGAERELQAAAEQVGAGHVPPGIGPNSLASPREAFDRDVFDFLSANVLNSAYGFALQFFFKASGLPPGRAQSWVSALATIDFALNGPLPPLVRPGRVRPQWDDLYPPARFLKASFAVRKCGGLPLFPEHEALARFSDEIAGAGGMPGPADYDVTVFDKVEPDFQVIKDGKVWDDLLGKPVNYYSFLRWCQQSLWDMRQKDLRRLVIPVIPMWELMNTNMQEAYSFVAGRLGYTSPLIFSADGEIEHALGSTTQFGTWLALSAAASHATLEIMAGVGRPGLAGFPQSLFTDKLGWEIFDGSIRYGLGVSYDPWRPPQGAVSARQG